jgi:transmembrane sensor
MTDDREQRDLDTQWEGLARFLAGESSPEEEQRIRAQLAGDAERAALVNALDTALARPDEAPLSQREVEAALASVMARRELPVDRAPGPEVIPFMARPSRRPVLERPRWRSVGLRAAAAVLLVAGLTVVWRGSRPTGRTAPAGQAVAAVNVHQTRAGEVDTVKLADGSTVVLGPESRLALGDDFGRKTREISFEGQAYFDVVHDDARPFVVRTSSATLRDIGTTFTVRSDSIGGTRVAVTSGAVDMVATRGAASSPTVLHAGDRAEVSGSGDSMRVERGAVTEAELSWTRGVLELRDAPLSLVATELRRWYGVELVVTDSTIASRRLTATFEHATADEVGRVLAAVLGGSVTRAGDTLRLGAAGAR